MIKQKIKASLIHLIISALVIGCFLAFALTIWYPEPFFSISGLQKIILILITVDLILGPLLTLVVFKPLKPTLKFDLSIIAIIQIAALTYGIHTIYEAHPLYIAYNADRFTIVSNNAVSPEKVKYDELKKSKLTGPTLVYVKNPSDPKEMMQIVMDVLRGKPDIDARPEYYEPFDKFTQDVLAHGLKPEILLAKPENKQKLEQFLQEHGKTANDYAFLPLSGKEDDVLWVWSRETSKPVGTLAINPWQQAQVVSTK